MFVTDRRVSIPTHIELDMMENGVSIEVVESFKKYTPCDPLKGAEYIKWYINEYKQNSIEVCKHCAYDKRVTDKLFNLKVVQLPSTKL